MEMKDHHYYLLAAMLGRTNMGQEHPDPEDLKWPITNEKMDLPNAVEAMCQQYMESDEHYDIFIDEATMWLGHVKGKSVQELQHDWPTHMKTLIAAHEISMEAG